MTTSIRFVTCFLLLTFLRMPVSAQAPAGGNAGVEQGLIVRQGLDSVQRGPPIRPGVHGSLSAGMVYIASSDKKDPRDISVRRWSMGAGVEHLATNGTMFGLVFDHELSRYDLPDDSSASTSRIDDAIANRFGVNVRRRLGAKWALFGNAATTFNVARGASWSHGRTAGGLLSFSRRVNERFSFSMGVVAQSQMEEHARIFPIPGLDWKITKRLSLRTAQGVTMSYLADARKRWVADITAGYESRAFRLGGSGALPGGVVKDRRVPLTMSVRYGPHPGMSARIFAGMVFAQQLEFMDSEGHAANTMDADPSLIAGLSASIRF